MQGHLSLSSDHTVAVQSQIKNNGAALLCRQKKPSTLLYLQVHIIYRVSEDKFVAMLSLWFICQSIAADRKSDSCSHLLVLTGTVGVSWRGHFKGYFTLVGTLQVRKNSQGDVQYSLNLCTGLVLISFLQSLRQIKAAKYLLITSILSAHHPHCHFSTFQWGCRALCLQHRCQFCVGAWNNPQ